MADRVDVSGCGVREKDSEFDFVIRLSVARSVDCPFPLGSVLWMNTLQKLFKRRPPIFQIKAKNAVPFLRKMQGFASRYRPGPTPSVGEPLRLRQVRLA